MEAPLEEVSGATRHRSLSTSAAALLLGIVVSWPGMAGAWETWRTLETENFDVHFPDGGYEFALRTAGYLEAAHEKLVPLIGHRPRLRTQVVLTDDVDFANGSARVVPYPLVRGFMAPPTADGFLHNYDDFLWLLMVHEYAHVLHLDKAGGIPEIGNRIFGRQFTPNHAAPRWLVEGLAVWIESISSAGGRNDSALAEMVIRAQIIEDGAPWPIDRMTGAPHSWPSGNVWYLHGGRTFAHLVSLRGEAAVTDFTEDYGSRVIPYLLNTSAKRSADISLVEAWRDWARVETERQEELVEELRSQGLMEGRRITDLGRTMRSLRWTKDGRLIALSSPGDSPTTLRSFEPDPDPPDGFDPGSVEMRAIGAHGFDLHPDGNHVVYSSREPFRLEQSYDDLFSANLEGGGRTRLTRGLRARDPALSSCGEMVAFVSRRRGETALYLAKLEQGEPAPKGRPKARLGPAVRVFHEAGVHVDRPSFSPDGSQMVFSLSRPDAGRDIVLLDLSSVHLPEMGDRVGVYGKRAPAPVHPEAFVDQEDSLPIQRLTDDAASDFQPVFSPGGDWVIFSSDRGGVFDIYALPTNLTSEADALPLRITRTTTGAFEPRPSPEGERLAYVTYRASGYDLAVMPLSFEGLETAPEAPPAPAPMNPDPSRLYPVRSYSPWRSARPYHWMPFLGADAFGQTIGISTRGTDAVGNHSWATSLWLGLGSHRPGYDARYTYRRFLPSLTISSGRGEYRSSAFHIREGRHRSYEERSFRLSAVADLRIPSNERSHSLALSMTADHRKVLGGIYPFDPGEPTPSIPEDGLVTRARLSWSSSSVRSFAETHVPVEGSRFRLSTEAASPRLGGDFGWVLVQAGATGHLRVPFTARHVLAANLDAGLGAGDFGGRRLFSLGGLPVDDIFTMVRSPGGRASTPILRGFAPYSIAGDAFTSANLEYRFPVFSLERGVYTLPVFFRRLHGAAFADGAFVAPRAGLMGAVPLRAGVGIEARAEFLVGYYQPVNLRLGWAHGFGEGAISAPYLGLGTAF